MNLEKALEIGGKEWKGGNNHRVYFNQEALIVLYGLKGEKIVNGRPRKWSRDGEKISNNKVFSLFNRNSYYDVVNDKMVDVNSDYIA